MIRVLHVIPLIGVGGTETLLLSQCRHRNRHEFEYRVACPAGETSGIGAEIERTGTPLTLGPARLLEAIRWADVVNVHVWSPDQAYLDFFAGCGRPHVLTVHWLFEVPRVPSVIVCTAAHTHGIQSPANRCVTIGNGIDVEQFAAPPRAERQEVIITRVCRPSKCAPYFWEVVGRVLERCPTARFRVIGNPEPCRHSSDRVEFLGIRRDIPALLADSDLFFYTPYPEIGSKDLVTMEASAAGLPCVVSDVSVVREAVEEGRNGFMTPFGDVEPAAAALERLVTNRALRLRMGAEAVRMAREQFDIREVTRRYEAVYESVLDAYRSRPGIRPGAAAVA